MKASKGQRLTDEDGTDPLWGDDGKLRSDEEHSRERRAKSERDQSRSTKRDALQKGNSQTRHKDIIRSSQEVWAEDDQKHASEP